MKFLFLKLPAIAGMLLPLLLLTRACDCPDANRPLMDAGESRCLAAGSCEMPPLPRLPRG